MRTLLSRITLVLTGAALLAAPLVAAAAPAPAGATGTAGVTAYDSIPSLLPTTLLSQPLGTGYAYTQFGAEVTLTGSGGHPTAFDVVLSSFACTSGTWSAGTCATPHGAIFSVPITLSFYTPSNLTTPIATTTKTFAVPYRPASTDGSYCPTSEYENTQGTCSFGLLDPVTFTLKSLSTTLPGKVVYTLGYKTYATTPTTVAADAPVNGLNVALVTTAQRVTAGSTTGGTLYTATTSKALAATTAGTSSNPGWHTKPGGSLYATPAVQIQATTVPAAPPVLSTPNVTYDAVPSPLPTTLLSQPLGEGYTFTQLGAEATLTAGNGHLTGVSAVLSSFACTSGTWAAGTCATSDGATFGVPITLSLYTPSNLTTPLATTTKTFAVPYRPASTDGSYCPTSEYENTQGTCSFAVLDTVKFTTAAITSTALPSKVVYTLGFATYPTTSGISASTPVNSVNVSLVTTTDGVTVGSTTGGTLYTATTSKALAATTAGTSSNPGWHTKPGGSLYATPAVQIQETVPVATGTAVTSTPNPSTAGSSVTFTATVAPAGTGGTVAFTYDGTSLGGCTAVPATGSGGSRQATCTTAQLPVGSDVVTATFSGTAKYLGSSGSVTQAVAATTPPSPPAGGYRLVGGNGGVYDFGNASYGGSCPAPGSGCGGVTNVVGEASAPSGGYWLAGATGGVYAFGGAPFYGSLGGLHLNAPITGIAATPTGGGYWLVSATGGIFAFGSAPYLGSLPAEHVTPAKPIVGMTPSSSAGGGYWLVGATGGIFSFGAASYYTSLPGEHVTPAKPVVGIATTPVGAGYWLVGATGGVFAFGNVGYYTSLPGQHVTPASPIVGLAAAPDGAGYWLVGATGGVFAFGNVGYYTSLPGQHVTPASPVVAISAT